MKGETKEGQQLSIWPIAIVCCLGLACVWDTIIAHFNNSPPTVGDDVVLTFVFLVLAFGFVYTFCAFSQRQSQDKRRAHLFHCCAFSVILLTLTTLLARAHALLSPAIGFAWVLVVVLWVLWCLIRTTESLFAQPPQPPPPVGMGLTLTGCALFMSCIFGGCQGGYEVYSDDIHHVVLYEPIFGKNVLKVYESRPFGRELMTQATVLFGEDVAGDISEAALREELGVELPKR